MTLVLKSGSAASPSSVFAKVSVSGSVSVGAMKADVFVARSGVVTRKLSLHWARPLH